MLTQHFQNWLASKQIVKTNKVLCAVSGGIDSMVLLELFRLKQFNLEVVHINYKLRELDSDKDQELVEKTCKKNNIPFHKLVITKPENTNLQEWARDQRFLYFDELKKKFDFEYVALAHHDEDQLETILLSIFKGYSLQTITSQRDYIIRPLLKVDKKLIDDFASANEIEYRLDKSNLSSNYDRNFLRNEIIPSLKKRVPNFKRRVLKFAERQKSNSNLLNKLVNEFIKNYLTEESNNINSISYKRIDLSLLETENGKEILLQYLKTKYSFSIDQIINLLESNKPEAQIMTDKFVAQKNSTALFVAGIQTDIFESSILQKNIPFKAFDLSLFVKASNQIQSFEEVLAVDFDKLQFPLVLKKADKSERFHAFGLKGAKTELTKFLKKSGKPAYFRSLDYIIKDAIGQIIIPSMEIDYRLRLDNSTKTCLIIDFQDKTAPIITETYQD